MTTQHPSVCRNTPILVFAIFCVCTIPTQLLAQNASEPAHEWVVLIPGSEIGENEASFAEFGFNSQTGTLYSLNTTKVTAYDLIEGQKSTVTIDTPPQGNYSVDVQNNRFIVGRSGRDNLYAAPLEGGSWTQIGNGSTDHESHGSSYFWNPVSGSVAYFGGYGGFRMKNWVMENRNQNWVEVISNNNECAPAKRGGQVATNKDGTVLYIFSGQGNCSGRQFETSCSLGSPWASDVGVWCWLRDLWSYDMNTESFTNILPPNSPSIKKEGSFAFDYDREAFYNIGGCEPPPVYRQDMSATCVDDVYRYKAGSEGFELIQVDGQAPSERGQAYYDSPRSRIIYASSEGIFALNITDPEQPAPGDLFKSTITVENALGASFTLHYGFDESATAGYDDGFDVFAPPPPPNGVFDARFTRDSEGYYRDYLPPLDSAQTWSLGFSAGTGGHPLTLRWDPAAVPDSVFLRLTDAVGGLIHDLDMGRDSLLTIETGGVDKLLISWNPTVEVSASYTAGWNLVGAPVRIPHQQFRELFPGAIANTLYSYEQVYKPQTVLQPGTGYWVRMSDASQQRFNGRAVDKLQTTLAQGWNLISGPTLSLSVGSIVDPDGVIISGTFYGFDGRYISASDLNPGNGYWVRASKPGTIEMDPYLPPPPPAKSAPNDPSGGVTARFESGGVVSRVVYGASLPSGRSFDLPPVPPSGILDVRLADGAWATESTLADVLIQQTDAPLSLTLQASASGGGSPARQHTVEFYSGERRLDVVRLASDATLNIPFDVDRVLMQSDAPELVQEFRLEQNHPNPFNPATRISYTLPSAQLVDLTVYSVTGAKVATLVQGEMPAGAHTVSFDASSLSSGVYVYRLTTPQASLSRTMILLK